MALTVANLLELTPLTRQGRDPRFTYLGAGAKAKMLDEWLLLVRGAVKYIDLTAGSCNQPYLIAKEFGIPVIVNDCCYYSYCIGSGIFERKEDFDFRKLAGVLLHALRLPNYMGVFSEMIRGRHILTDAAAFIDALVHFVDFNFNLPEAHFIKACLGRTMITHLAMRGISFAKPENAAMNDPESLAKEVFRTALAKDHYRALGMVNWGYMQRFVHAVDLRNATVNIDPAWPFRTTTPNPYYFYTILGQILRQDKDETQVCFWKDETDPNAIAEELLEVVDACLTQDAREVFIWNQTSNRPSKEVLIETFSGHFRCGELFSTQRVGRHNVRFQDYVLRVRS